MQVMRAQWGRSDSIRRQPLRRHTKSGAARRYLLASYFHLSSSWRIWPSSMCLPNSALRRESKSLKDFVVEVSQIRCVIRALAEAALMKVRSTRTVTPLSETPERRRPINNPLVTTTSNDRCVESWLTASDRGAPTAIGQGPARSGPSTRIPESQTIWQPPLDDWRQPNLR